MRAITSITKQFVGNGHWIIGGSFDDENGKKITHIIIPTDTSLIDRLLDDNLQVEQDAIEEAAEMIISDYYQKRVNAPSF